MSIDVPLNQLTPGSHDIVVSYTVNEFSIYVGADVSGGRDYAIPARVADA